MQQIQKIIRLYRRQHKNKEAKKRMDEQKVETHGIIISIIQLLDVTYYMVQMERIAEDKKTKLEAIELEMLRK